MLLVLTARARGATYRIVTRAVSVIFAPRARILDTLLISCPRVQSSNDKGAREEEPDESIVNVSFISNLSLYPKLKKLAWWLRIIERG